MKSRLVCVSVLSIKIVLTSGCTPEPAQPTESPEQSATTEKKDTRKPNPTWAMNLFERQQYDKAFDEASQVLISDPTNAQALFVVASVTYERGNVADAISTLRSIPTDHLQLGFRVQHTLADWLFKDGQWDQADAMYNSMLASNPGDAASRRKLIELYNLQGRRYEANELTLPLLKAGEIDRVYLLALLDPTEPFDAREKARSALEKHPQQVLPHLSLANHASFAKSTDEAIAEFQVVIASPDAPQSAFANLALVYARTGRWNDLIPLLQRFDTTAWNTPNFWIAAGIFLEEQDRYDDAITAYVNALTINSAESEALAAVARLLTASGNPEAAADVAHRLKRVATFHERIKVLSRNMKDQASMLGIAKDLQFFGREFEALSWLALATNGKPNSAEQAAWMQQLAEIVRVEEINFGKIADSLKPFARSKSFDFTPYQVSDTDMTDRNFSVDAKISFQNIAPELGIDFAFLPGPLKDGGMNIYQSNGAGIGIIDYDLNGWPDIYLPQSAGLPLQAASDRINAFYRNLDGNAREVHTPANLHHEQWGQGVAVGDVNADGFPDMFVASIGQNQVWLNQGDGTFQAMEIEQLETDLTSMTISVAMADVNGDTYPDLIEANYSEVQRMFEHICHDAEGKPRVCSPTEFISQADRILLSCGDGSFVTAEDAWQLSIDGGRGLGVIVGNFDEKAGNDVYIANDMNANHYLISSPANNESNGPYRLTDQAALRGVALDGQGRAQASMGVAAGDFNRDGLCDIFITNFYDEFNVMYRGQRGGMFVDSTAMYGLEYPNKKTLGFGTQTFDCNRDGYLDLFVVNGHVDDFRAEGKPYQMTPELWLGSANGFRNATADVQSDYFNTPTVARVLTMLDWDRDGRVDLAASHLDHPFALLRNNTESSMHYIQLELAGVNSDRDATGAIVTLDAGKDRWVTQVIRGSGFQCSNEAFLDVGIQSHSTVNVTVQWPNGETQTWNGLAADRRFLLIEGQADAVER